MASNAGCFFISIRVVLIVFGISSIPPAKAWNVSFAFFDNLTRVDRLMHNTATESRPKAPMTKRTYLTRRELVARADGLGLLLSVQLSSGALYVDGSEAVNLRVCRKSGRTVIPGKLTGGKANLAVGGTLYFSGTIDDLRLVRHVSGVPSAALQADAQTTGLWSFDIVEGASDFSDASVKSNRMQVHIAESLD